MSTILGGLKSMIYTSKRTFFCGLMSRLKILSREISSESEVKKKQDVNLFEELAVDRTQETLDNHGKF